MRWSRSASEASRLVQIMTKLAKCLHVCLMLLIEFTLNNLVYPVTKFTLFVREYGPNFSRIWSKVPTEGVNRNYYVGSYAPWLAY